MEEQPAERKEEQKKEKGEEEEPSPNPKARKQRRTKKSQAKASGSAEKNGDAPSTEEAPVDPKVEMAWKSQDHYHVHCVSMASMTFIYYNIYIFLSI